MSNNHEEAGTPVARPEDTRCGVRPGPVLRSVSLFDRIRHVVSFEIIGLALVTPLGAWVFHQPMLDIGVLSAIIAVVAMVMAAAVLTGVLDGTGMVKAMSEWLVQVIPSSWGPFMAIITGLISIPATFFMSNDAFYYGILPVLTDTAAHYGIPAVDMARASITGQPVHLQSPLVPAILLLVSLAGVNLGDHHKKVLWRALVISLVMLAVGVLVGAIGFGHS